MNNTNQNHSSIWTPAAETKLALTVIHTLIFISGIIGNFIFCFVLYHNKSLQTATNCYLCSMSVSDLIVLFFGYPFEIFFIWSDAIKFTNEGYHLFHSFMLETSTNATLLTISVFTAERYIGICHPMKRHFMPQLSRVSKFLFIVWVVSIFWGLIVVGCGNFSVDKIVVTWVMSVSFVIFFAVPMVGIIVLYVLISIELKSTQNMLSVKTNNRVSRVQSSHVQIEARNRDVIKILVSVVVAFFVCYSPFQVQRLISVLGDAKHKLTFEVFRVMTHISGVSLYVSTCVNPFLYHMSKRFRNAAKKTFGCRIDDESQSTRRFYSSSKFQWMSRSQSYLTSTNTKISEVPHVEDTKVEQSHILGQMSQRKSSTRLLNNSTHKISNYPLTRKSMSKSSSFLNKFMKKSDRDNNQVSLVAFINNPSTSVSGQYLNKRDINCSSNTDN